MFLGRVIGHVWATKKWPELTGLKLLVVRPHTLAELGRADPPQQCDDAVIAADLLGACVGEDVILAYGHAAIAVNGAVWPEPAVAADEYPSPVGRDQGEFTDMGAIADPDTWRLVGVGPEYRVAANAAARPEVDMARMLKMRTPADVAITADRLQALPPGELTHAIRHLIR